MNTTPDTPVRMPIASSAPTVRDNMETIAQTLKLELGAAQDAGLGFRVSTRVPATVAPGRNGRLVAILRIANAEQVPSTLWISALSEAAGWGLNGERQRFVVVDGHFALLWTTPPLPAPELLDQLYELFATAVVLADFAGAEVH
jgi:hypothetical protein